MPHHDTHNTPNPFESPRADLTPAEDAEIPYGWFYPYFGRPPEFKKLPRAEAGRVHRLCLRRYGWKSPRLLLGLLLFVVIVGIAFWLVDYLSRVFGYKSDHLLLLFSVPTGGLAGYLLGGFMTAYLRPYYAQCIREGWHIKPEKKEPRVIISVPEELE